mgnify:CR=1 FL=1
MGQSKLGIGVKVAGSSEVIEALRGVKFGVGNRVLKGELRKVASKANKIAKSGLTTTRTGLLKKSIGVVHRPARGKPGAGAYIVGPRRGFGMVIGQTESKAKRLIRRLTGKKAPKKPKLSKTITKRFKGRKVDPVKYAHLVEGGRGMTVPKLKKALADGETVFGKRVRAVAPKPFMKPAAAYAMQAGAAEIAAGVKAGIAREAAKYAAKGKSIYGATT